jgi:hypothetical protein
VQVTSDTSFIAEALAGTESQPMTKAIMI